jgi:type IV pilus assembly protein PilP
MIRSDAVGRLLCACILAGLLAACEEDRVSAPRGSGTPAAAPAAAAEEGAEEEKKREPVAYTDDDFVESERNRDPFRSYVTAFQAKAPDEIQRKVVMPTTSIEAMKLIAIVMGIPTPKAMIVDPMGMGHTVERGMYIGQPKIIQATGNVSMTLNWRVDRIRENEVVLTRQDPSDPNRPALTRVIPLREELAKN